MQGGVIAIRPARPSDATVASVLLYSAYTHIRLAYPWEEREADDDGVVVRLGQFFGREDNRFSYRNALLANTGKGVVGLVLSFGGKDEARLNAAVGIWVEREAHDDEWYVDALAVLKEWEHKGIGGSLMRAAEHQAVEHRYPRIALHVAVGNGQAIALYMRLGYVPCGEVILYQRPHLRMVKALEY
jgi:ribosomal protein S18 acetylase RimI-like enzyme